MNIETHLELIEKGVKSFYQKVLRMLVNISPEFEQRLKRISSEHIRNVEAVPNRRLDQHVDKVDTIRVSSNYFLSRTLHLNFSGSKLSKLNPLPRRKTCISFNA